MAFRLRIPTQAGRVPVLLLGDSTTYGTGNSGFAYRKYLMQKLRPPYYVDFVGPYKSIASPTTEVDQDHSGISGDTLSNMNTRVVTEIGAYGPKLILLMGGVNDIAISGSASTALTRLSTLLATIYSTNPAIVTLCCKLPCDSASAYYTNVGTFNDGVAAVVAARVTAGQSVSYVDNFTGVTCGAGDVHPDDTGYQVIAANWYAGLVAYAPAVTALQNAA